MWSYRDITERRHRRALKEERHVLELNRTGAAIASTLDLQTVQCVTDAGTALSGANSGAFYFNTQMPTASLPARRILRCVV